MCSEDTGVLNTSRTLYLYTGQWSSHHSIITYLLMLAKVELVCICLLRLLIILSSATQIIKWSLFKYMFHYKYIANARATSISRQSFGNFSLLPLSHAVWTNS